MIEGDCCFLLPKRDILYLMLYGVGIRRMRRRALFKRPINSVKNIVDSTAIGVAGATNTVVTLASAVNAYTGAVTDVPIGAKVAGVYLFFQVACDATNANVDAYVAKSPGALPVPNPGATGGHVYRKYILHEEKGLPGTYTAGSAPLTYRGYIAIPKGRQRFAEGDVMFLSIRGAQQYSSCVKCIYKFYQ